MLSLSSHPFRLSFGVIKKFRKSDSCSEHFKCSLVPSDSVFVLGEGKNRHLPSITKDKRLHIYFELASDFGIHGTTQFKTTRCSIFPVCRLDSYICILWFMYLIFASAVLRFNVFAVYDNDSNLDIRSIAWFSHNSSFLEAVFCFYSNRMICQQNFVWTFSIRNPRTHELNSIYLRVVAISTHKIPIATQFDDSLKIKRERLRRCSIWAQWK